MIRVIKMADNADELTGGKLRELYENALSELKTAKAELAAKAKVEQEQLVNNVLSAKGVNAKFAKFIFKDVEEVTSESVENWITENADIVGLSGDATTAAVPNVTSDELAAVNRMNNLTNVAKSPERMAEINARIAAETDPKKIDSLMAEARNLIL